MQSLALLLACAWSLLRPEEHSAIRCLQGCTFVNQYVVVKTLGQGAYGKVKLCLNSEDHNLYALKLVSKVGAQSFMPPLHPVAPRHCHVGACNSGTSMLRSSWAGQQGGCSASLALRRPAHTVQGMTNLLHLLLTQSMHSFSR
jgi:hypothetical protein